MKTAEVSLMALAGLLFGLGLTISGMVNPAKVLGFLDLFGAWDPSLAFVMGGAVVVTAVGYRLVWRRSKPLFSPAFPALPRGGIDRRLVIGGLLFGIGWGLVGLCPGPALAGLVLGEPMVWLFVAAMLAGMALAGRVRI